MQIIEHLKNKKAQNTSEVIGELVTSDKNNKPLRVLLDSGTSATIILKTLRNKIPKVQTQTTKWRTMGGTFKTTSLASVSFKLPEFSNNKIIKWKMHVNETTPPNKTQYDLIIGTDLLSALKIDLLYLQGQIMLGWGHCANEKLQHSHK